ncbi:MAG: ATP-binding cassette domain-containing protein [Candidatus Bathyarchaeia archaeon]
MDCVIEASDLCKYYGSIRAVDHVSFKVSGGEFYGFLGPNGAGKTTTIRILTGVIKPDSGSAHVMGYDVVREPIKAKQVMGVLPEAANAYTDLTAWQNLMFLGALYGLPKKSRIERARILLENFGLYERRNQTVRGFSKGMKQRLLICMALLNDPQVLFLDEPTAGLDVQSSRLIRDMLRKLSNEGTTMFLTTHDMDEANQLCDRIAIINHGRIAAVDTPEKLRSMVAGLQSIEVTFDKRVDLKPLSGLPSVLRVEKRGDKIRLYSEDLSELFHQLFVFAEDQGLRFLSLNTLGPSLEDAFIKLTEERPA